MPLSLLHPLIMLISFHLEMFYMVWYFFVKYIQNYRKSIKGSYNFLWFVSHTQWLQQGSSCSVLEGQQPAQFADYSVQTLINQLICKLQRVCLCWWITNLAGRWTAKTEVEQPGLSFALKVSEWQGWVGDQTINIKQQIRISTFISWYLFIFTSSSYKEDFSIKNKRHVQTQPVIEQIWPSTKVMERPKYAKLLREA